MYVNVCCSLVECKANESKYINVAEIMIIIWIMDTIKLILD